MLRFMARRLVLLVPVALGILLVTFLIVRLIPGDPCIAMLGERATEAKCEEFKDRYGLNDNVLVQFGRYIAAMATGDFGESIRFSRPVADVIAERLPMTIELTIFAMLFSTSVGIFLGIISALKPNSFADTFTMVLANIGIHACVLAWINVGLLFCPGDEGHPAFYPTIRPVKFQCYAGEPG